MDLRISEMAAGGWCCEIVWAQTDAGGAELNAPSFLGHVLTPIL
jgi:hypothetical protein